MSAVNKPILFLSFTSTMNALTAGAIDVAELDVGLFVFGCTRSHALNPWKEIDENVDDEQRRLHALLVTALLKAEQDGRVRFRKLEDHPNSELVDELLIANGYKPLSSGAEYSAIHGCDANNVWAIAARSTELKTVPRCP